MFATSFCQLWSAIGFEILGNRARLRRTHPLPRTVLTVQVRIWIFKAKPFELTKAETEEWQRLKPLR
jgi:hypothetical protein